MDIWRTKKFDYTLKIKPIRYQSMKLKPFMPVRNRPRFKPPDVPNAYDCAPKNPRKQGLGHLVAGRLKQSTGTKQQSSAYDMYSKGEHMYLEGQKMGDQAMMAEGSAMMERANELLTEGVESYTAGEEMIGDEMEQISENIEAGLKFRQPKKKSNLRPRMRLEENPAKPPYPKGWWRGRDDEYEYQGVMTHPQMVQYRPVTWEKVSVKYRPVRAPYQRRRYEED